VVLLLLDHPSFCGATHPTTCLLLLLLLLLDMLLLLLLLDMLQAFANGRQNLHITVFHFSHPADPRPDALQPGSGLEALGQTSSSSSSSPSDGSSSNAPSVDSQQTEQDHQQQQQGEVGGGGGVLQPTDGRLSSALIGAAGRHHVNNMAATAAAAAPPGQTGQQQQQQQGSRPGPSDLPGCLQRLPGPSAAQVAAEQAAAAALLAQSQPITLQVGPEVGPEGLGPRQPPPQQSGLSCHHYQELFINPAQQQH
jgi:hypothetical protein